MVIQSIPNPLSYYEEGALRPYVGPTLFRDLSTLSILPQQAEGQWPYVLVQEVLPYVWAKRNLFHYVAFEGRIPIRFGTSAWKSQPR